MGRKFRNVDWDVSGSDSGKIANWEMVKIALLMDLRDELQRLNGLLHCPNFTAIPSKLDRISHNTAKPRKKK